MSIKAILFDLDGTLLPMELNDFLKDYYGRLVARLSQLGYEPKTLRQSFWTGTVAMLQNDGSRTNEEAFWDGFCQTAGQEIRAQESVFEEFYKTEFQLVKDSCGFDPRAAEAVRFARELGFAVILATNPVFPAVATESRIRWAGLEPEEFSLYTTFENSHYCKPNPMYYEEVLTKIGLTAQQCVMVGNDTSDDLSARKAGLQVFLLTPCLINKEDVDISQIPHGGFLELREYLEQIKEK